MKHGLNVKKGNIPKMPNIFFVPRKQKQIEEIIFLPFNDSFTHMKTVLAAIQIFFLTEPGIW